MNTLDFMAAERLAVTAPATPTVTVTALDAIEGALYAPALVEATGDAFDVTRALVDAALAPYRGPLSASEHAAALEAQRQAAFRYLAWHPAPATVTSGDSGGASGGEER